MNRGTMGYVKWQMVVVVLALTPSPASADGFCIVGRQTCDYIGLFELHIDKELVSDHGGSSKLAVDIAAGVMTRSGFGVTVGARSYDYSPDTYFMVRGRYRWWAGPMTGLDVSVAPLLGEELRAGINVQLAAEYADQIGVYVGFDAIRVSESNGGSQTAISASAGIRFSNIAAVPATLLGYLYALTQTSS